MSLMDMRPKYFHFENNLYPLAAFEKLSIERHPVKENYPDYRWRVRIHFSNGDSYLLDECFKYYSEVKAWCHDIMDANFYSFREWTVPNK